MLLAKRHREEQQKAAGQDPTADADADVVAA